MGMLYVVGLVNCTHTLTIGMVVWGFREPSVQQALPTSTFAEWTPDTCTRMDREGS